MTAVPGRTVALITGGASGIGLALGRRLAEGGVRVVLADVDPTGLALALEALPDPSLGEVLRLDVTDAAAVRSAVEGVAARHGRIDYLFNNAGVGATKDMRDTRLDDWRRIVELNIMGVVHGVDAAYPIMVGQGHGHIVNTSSIAGLMPWPGQTMYNTTKYAVVGLSHTLRWEAARFGVKVSVVCPGPVRSAIWGTSLSGARDPSKAPPPDAIPADAAATAIWRGVRADKATIIVPAASARQAWAYRLHPGLVGRAFARRVRSMRP